MSNIRAPVTAAILAFPDTSASVVHGLYDLFASAGRDWGVIVNGRPGPSLIKPVVVSSRRDPFTTMNGLTIIPECSLDECERPTVVCVSELSLPPDTPLDGRFDREIDWLRRCYAGGATLATACSGAMLLAQAGMLDGLEATTHWAWCDALRKRHPKVTVHERRALVISGEAQRLVMAGGGTTFLDLALYVIARFAGLEAAMQVARLTLIDWHTSGQQPYARLMRSRQVEDAVIARCQEWIAHHYREPAPVAAMVRLSGLAERTFKRRFQAATDMSPLEYVHTLRLEEAKQMLESGEQPIEVVANEVGYEDSGFFSRLFVREVSLTPMQYRRRFGAMRRALQSG